MDGNNAVVARDTQSGNWCCTLNGIQGKIPLYQGKNANKAMDMKDEVEMVLAKGFAPRAQCGRLEKDGVKHWAVSLSSGEFATVIEWFGVGGANKAADFADSINKALGAK